MTDQCTYTGRYDRLSKAPSIIKRGTGGDAFDASCEATLAKAMQRDARERAEPAELRPARRRMGCRAVR
jgi:hypothetical protein